MIPPRAPLFRIGSTLKNTDAAFLKIYDLLFRRYGPQRWWPGDSPFEVMVGAILTQSTAWQNVEKAIVNLKTAGMMSPAALRAIPAPALAQLIYPAGYYNAKAVKLQALVRWLSASCGDNLNELFARDTGELRLQLLAVHGIGPETADSILLYAGNKPVFVIDAYTRRVFSRLGLKPENDTYDDWQMLFTRNLPQNTQLFNEYHALLVRLGKESCRKQPVCDNCCLRVLCRFQF
jgi:endonuclease III related protein